MNRYRIGFFIVKANNPLKRFFIRWIYTPQSWVRDFKSNEDEITLTAKIKDSIEGGLK